ncbi:MAG: ABC transporter substrate-binding protein [Peptococcaceae bacterium]|nr:ABC transporter substrate-binding protein [Peptococcaceae bacterium]
MRKILIITVLLLLGAVAVWLFLNLPKPAPKEQITVRETQRLIAHIPHYAAAALGYFHDQGLDVTLTTSATGYIEDPGQADIIITQVERIFGTQVKAFVALTRHEPCLLLAREKNKDFQWDQVKNKTIIAGPPDSTAQVALEEILKKNHLIPQMHVIIVQNLPLHLRRGAFLSGSGSFIILPDPAAARMENNGQGWIMASLAEAGEIPARVCAATPAFLSEHPDTAVAYARAIYQAQRWLKKHEAGEIAALVGPFFPDMGVKSLTRAIQRAKDTGLWTDTPVIEPAQYERLQQIFVAAGELPQKIPYEKFAAAQYAQDALNNIPLPTP